MQRSPIAVVLTYIILVSSLCFIAAWGTQEAKAAAPGKGRILHLKTFQIMDNQGFGQPLAARTLLAPVDWQLQGGVQWTGIPCIMEMYKMQATVSDPKGGPAFEIFPDYKWQWTNDQLTQQSVSQSGCRIATPLDPRGVLEQVLLPGFRQGARLVKWDSSPEAARAAYQKSMEYVGPMVQSGQTQLATDAGKALIEYQMNGRMYEEWITVTLVIMTMQAWNNSAMLQGQMIPEPHQYFTATNMYGFRAPRGQLKEQEKLAATIMSSIRANPVWSNAIMRVTSNITQNAIHETAKRAAMMRDAMNEIGERRMQTWQQNNKTLDKVSQSFGRMIRGVDAYLDPLTNQTVELTLGYDNAWSNGDGHYILSTEAGFDPNFQLRTDYSWKQMKIQR